jgi:hypothetical protein
VPVNVPFATSWPALLTAKLVIVKTPFSVPPDCAKLIGTVSAEPPVGGAAVASGAADVEAATAVIIAARKATAIRRSLIGLPSFHDPSGSIGCRPARRRFAYPAFASSNRKKEARGRTAARSSSSS